MKIWPVTVEKSEGKEAQLPSLEKLTESLPQLADAKGKTPAAAPRAKTSQTVRVDVQRLENLMNRVGELVIDRTRLTDVSGALEAKLGVDELVDTLEEVTVHVGRITGDLQEEIMSENVPLNRLTLSRMVRDLSQSGKRDRIHCGRQGDELDRR